MNIADKSIELLLGGSLTGLVSTVIWLLKWCDRLDLESHDLRRDVAHLQRNYQALSATVAALDTMDDQIVASFKRSLSLVDRRFTQVETRIYVLEIRLTPATTTESQN